MLWQCWGLALEQLCSVQKGSDVPYLRSQWWMTCQLGIMRGIQPYENAALITIQCSKSNTASGRRHWTSVHACVCFDSIGNNIHHEAKKNNFLLCASFLVLDRNWWISSHTLGLSKVPISYNSVYFILACVENFAVTVTLNILCLPVK